MGKNKHFYTHKYTQKLMSSRVESCWLQYIQFKQNDILSLVILEMCFYINIQHVRFDLNFLFWLMEIGRNLCYFNCVQPIL